MRGAPMSKKGYPANSGDPQILLKRFLRTFNREVCKCTDITGGKKPHGAPVKDGIRLGFATVGGSVED